MRNKLYELRADLLLLTVAIAWGVTFLMVQDAISTTPVYAFLFFRFTLHLTSDIRLLTKLFLNRSDVHQLHKLIQFRHNDDFRSTVFATSRI